MSSKDFTTPALGDGVGPFKLGSMINSSIDSKGKDSVT